MSLRIVEVILPSGEEVAAASLLAEGGALDVWPEELPGGKARVRALLRTERTEAVLDQIERRFGGRSGFRVLLLRVEATLPKPPDEETKPPAAGEAPGGEAKEAARERISREELYEDLEEGARLSRVYLVTVALSTLVASIGLVRGEIAVIIGAMVIAPLLGPNVALALAVTLGDLPLAARAVRTSLAGIAVAALLSASIGAAIPIDPAEPELATRTALSLPDVLLASAAGSAGALAFTQGLPAALIGVMVAVALLPPLVTAGLFLGSGNLAPAARAAALLATNVACVNLAGVLTFLAQRIRPRTWWEEKKARKATRIAIAFWLAVIALLLLLVLLVWRE